MSKHKKKKKHSHFESLKQVNKRKKSPNKQNVKSLKISVGTQPIYNPAICYPR